MSAQHIESSHNQVSTKMASVSMQKRSIGSNIGTHSGLFVGVGSLEFEIGRHEEVDELGVCCGSCSTGIDVGSNIVYFFAIFLYDDGSSSGSGIGCEYDSSVEFASYDGGSCFFMCDAFDDIFFF